MSSPIQLGAKGRISLPAAVRRAAHIPDGASVVAHAEGKGRIVIETEDAIRARVWAAAATPVELDAAADIRALRSEDSKTADEAAARRAAAPARTAADDDAGARLLAHLGL